ncbi:MAG TPA: LPS assembly lipoprotein LptE [Candidatus Omnitrophota bacterium]|jgi:hypothetical protein|nr:LPS assembly lipoprotein LptE [Candidatus Omnitrophota bacterium]HSA30972.1 LPS assembly lipoprotein LptE [Candidatus Omnitrophota bacterium]
MKKWVFVAVLFACLGMTGVWLAGCGYTTTSALSSDLQTIYVEHFKNNIDFETASRVQTTYIPLLEVDIRTAVINRFQFDGNLKVSANKEDADLILSGELVEYNRYALRYTDEDDVQEYRLQLVMKLTMTDTTTGEPLWTSNRFIGEKDYFLQGPRAVSEDTAIGQATEDLARRIVEKTIENW